MAQCAVPNPACVRFHTWTLHLNWTKCGFFQFWNHIFTTKMWGDPDSSKVNLPLKLFQFHFFKDISIISVFPLVSIGVARYYNGWNFNNSSLCNACWTGFYTSFDTIRWLLLMAPIQVSRNQALIIISVCNSNSVFKVMSFTGTMSMHIVYIMLIVCKFTFKIFKKLILKLFTLHGHMEKAEFF